MTAKTHQAIREAIRTRIKAGEWRLGAQMPGETEFAAEYDCARTTVNRALRALADEGIVERKRKGGTRVRPFPLPVAQFRIPVLREQVKATGQSYRHQLLDRAERAAPADVRARMQLQGRVRLLWLESLHLADDRPFALERRWVNLDAVPAFAAADLTAISANEWLVREVPFSTGQVAMSATSADSAQSARLGVDAGSPLFTLQRTTWRDSDAITTMQLFYAAPYSLTFSI